MTGGEKGTPIFGTKGTLNYKKKKNRVNYTLSNQELSIRYQMISMLTVRFTQEHPIILDYNHAMVGILTFDC